MHFDRHQLAVQNQVIKQHAAPEDIRTQIWNYYHDLKAYKEAPSVEKKAALETRPDEIFTTQTCFATLNQALKRLHKNKSELLLVLDRPDIPLHNNTSERDIRDYVKKRKISGSTQSELGRRCRDTSASLKKTCRKLGISFWKSLNDRLSGRQSQVPPKSRRLQELRSSSLYLLSDRQLSVPWEAGAVVEDNLKPLLGS